MKQQKTIYILLRGLFSSLFSCSNDKHSQEFIEITSRTEEGFQDIVLTITDYKKTTNEDFEIVIKGRYNKTIVGLKVILPDRLSPGIVNDEIDNTAFRTNGVKFISLGRESNEFVKVLSELYHLPTDKEFSKGTVSFDIFSLNQERADLENGYYKFKLFYDPNDDYGLYCEIFLNINLPAKELELPEKDEEYRENLIRAMTKNE
jgi:hypothetical protein